jgi:hypothetical protein
MMKSRLFGAAAILAAVVAAPAMAQGPMQEPGAYTQAHPWAGYYPYHHYRYVPGFWPGDPADANAYLRHPTDDDYYATYYGDRPVTRLTTCGLNSDAKYLGPDGRWYPC